MDSRLRGNDRGCAEEMPDLILKSARIARIAKDGNKTSAPSTHTVTPAKAGVHRARGWGAEIVTTITPGRLGLTRCPHGFPPARE